MAFRVYREKQIKDNGSYDHSSFSFSAFSTTPAVIRDLKSFAAAIHDAQLAVADTQITYVSQLSATTQAMVAKTLPSHYGARFLAGKRLVSPVGGEVMGALSDVGGPSGSFSPTPNAIRAPVSASPTGGSSVAGGSIPGFSSPHVGFAGTPSA